MTTLLLSAALSTVGDAGSVSIQICHADDSGLWMSRRLTRGRLEDGSLRSRAEMPLTPMSGTSAYGIGIVGSAPDHSITLVRNMIRQWPSRSSRRSK